MGYIKDNHGAHEDKRRDGGDCGAQFPSNSNVSGGTGVEATNVACKGTVKVSYTTASNIQKHCGIHRNANAQEINSGFANRGLVIKHADIKNLLRKIKFELNSKGRSNVADLPSSIPTEINPADFQKMGDAIQGNTGKSFSFGSDPFGIKSTEVKKLVDEYNKLTNQCVCHSDCGSNLTCSCHNNCGCHY